MRGGSGVPLWGAARGWICPTVERSLLGEPPPVAAAPGGFLSPWRAEREATDGRRDGGSDAGNRAPPRWRGPAGQASPPSTMRALAGASRQGLGESAPSAIIDGATLPAAVFPRAPWICGAPLGGSRRPGFRRRPRFTGAPIRPGTADRYPWRRAAGASASGDLRLRSWGFCVARSFGWGAPLRKWLAPSARAARNHGRGLGLVPRTSRRKLQRSRWPDFESSLFFVVRSGGGPFPMRPIRGSGLDDVGRRRRAYLGGANAGADRSSVNLYDHSTKVINVGE